MDQQKTMKVVTLWKYVNIKNDTLRQFMQYQVIKHLISSTVFHFSFDQVFDDVMLHKLPQHIVLMFNYLQNVFTFTFFVSTLLSAVLYSFVVCEEKT